jgi:hypothetical protein
LKKPTTIITLIITIATITVRTITRTTAPTITVLTITIHIIIIGIIIIIEKLQMAGPACKMSDGPKIEWSLPYSGRAGRKFPSSDRDIGCPRRRVARGPEYFPGLLGSNTAVIDRKNKG